ncbi:DUF58 domain-containing protein [Marilutibacter aestuarii]|uniref:DUF58 domain-containing protein n=1 Tax=Marilutibacter aestuarii TaxID=1706195 RepID=A0A507ZVZ5_9GAMM|nr:DUF58 domain-containing protein [Lysobacter aestuarii]TQD41880.1 DUF58 domain-containing protein [Lysobacter aestuarii]
MAQVRPTQAQATGEGIAPTLAELVALKSLAGARRTPKSGRHGIAGPALSPLRGRGMDYAESREYVAGDDARHIDWKLTARTGRAHTKMFQAERERLTLIVGDTAPALYFGTRVRFKSVQAARAGAIAAWVAARDGDRIAALRGSVHEPPVPPAAGTRGALRTLDALVRWYARPPGDDGGLGMALDHAQRLLRPGSRLVVLADAGSVADTPAQRWPVLAQHHEVILLMLVDPLEVSPPKAVLPLSAGTEGASRLELDLGASRVRARWRASFGAPVATALAQLPARGVRVAALSTADASDAWLPLLGRPRPQVA